MSTNSVSLVLYGTNESWNDPDKSFNVLVYTSAMDPGIVQFRSAAEGREFLSSMTALKNAIANRGQDYHSGAIDETEWRRWLTHTWLPQTEAFCVEWSRACVPSDIRHSIDDVNANLGLDPVHWPPPLSLRTFPDGSFQLV